VARTHYEDKQDSDFSIDPANFLERIGIVNFSINREGLIVYLPAPEFQRLAWKIGRNIVSTTRAFYAFGWQWQRVGRR